MRAVFIALVLAACHREVRQDVKFQEEDEQKTAKTTDETVVETKTQAATEVDIKTTREDNALIIRGPSGVMTVVPIVNRMPTTLPLGSVVVGMFPLVKTTKDESKHVGPKTDEKKTEKKSDEKSDETKKLAGAAKLEEVTDVGLGWKFYLTVFAIVVAALVALYCYLKFIRKVGWL